MAQVVAALDEFTKTSREYTVGENGHVQFSHSDDFKEQILQLSFELIRTTSHNKIEEQFRKILDNIGSLNIFVNSADTTLEPSSKLYYLNLICRLIIHTRDYLQGKGEQDLSYLLLYVLYDYYPSLAENMFYLFINKISEKTPYGSWRDVKYMCNYILNATNNKRHPFIIFICNICCEQLKLDLKLLNQVNVRKNISLFAKWFPREKCKRFGWMFNIVAESCYYYYFNDIDTNNPHHTKRYKMAKNKAHMKLRKGLANLNRHLKTTQIDQCGKNYSGIDYNTVTSKTLFKQKKAFMNITKTNTVRYPEDEDRVIAADNFNKFIEEAMDPDTSQEIKGKALDMVDFVREAIKINDTREEYRRRASSDAESNVSKMQSLQQEENLLNKQWNDNSENNKVLDNIICVVDLSESMYADKKLPFYSSIGLGCRCAEKSKLGRRVLTICEEPTWLNLDDCDTFTDMVMSIKNAKIGYNTNFSKTMDLILDSFITMKLLPEEVSDFILLFASDMQADATSNEDYTSTLHEEIVNKFKVAGIEFCGKPYPVPHIVYWNLRATNGFPVLSTSTNITMVSGYNASLLNLFCEEGISKMRETTGWDNFILMLEAERYNDVSAVFNKWLDTDLLRDR